MEGLRNSAGYGIIRLYILDICINMTVYMNILA